MTIKINNIYSTKVIEKGHKKKKMLKKKLEENLNKEKDYLFNIVI